MMKKPIKENFLNVLTESFNDTQLKTFIFTYFDEVYNSLGTSDKDAKMLALLEYCQQNQCFQKLHDALETKAPKAQFNKHKPYFEGEQTEDIKANNLKEPTEEEKTLKLIKGFDFSMREQFQDFIADNKGGIVVVHGKSDYGLPWAFDILLRELQKDYPYFDKPLKLSGKQNTATIQHFFKGIFRRKLHLNNDPKLSDIETLLKEDEKRVMLCADLSKIEFLHLIQENGFMPLSACIAQNQHFLFFFVAEEMEETDLPKLPDYWLFLPKLAATTNEVEAWITMLRSQGTRLHRNLSKTLLCQCCDNPLNVLMQISKQLSTPLDVYDWD
jgi:hypothetical protein